MERTEDGGGRGEQWLPGELLPPVSRQDDESRRRREPGYGFICSSQIHRRNLNPGTKG